MALDPKTSLGLRFFKAGFSTLLFASIAIAQPIECETVDLRKSMGPVSDQGKVNWCYALTLSDIISHKVGYRVSGADIAISYNNEINPGAVGLFDKLTSGDLKKPAKDSGPLDPAKVLDAVRRSGGVCPETIIPSTFDGEDLVNVLKAVTETAASSPSTCTRRTTLAQELFPQIPSTSFRKVLGKISSNFTSEDWFQLAHKNCQKERKPLPSGFKIKFFGPPQYSQKDFASVIDQQLSAGNPVAAGISTAQIRDSNGLARVDAAIGMLVDQFTRSMGDNVIATHALSIVGRHFNSTTNQCEYLLRNSTGLHCEGIKKELCQDGHIVVTKSELIRSLQMIYFAE